MEEDDKIALWIGSDINWWPCDGGPYVAVKEGSILSARFHPPATILGHSASSLEAKNAQFYWQGEPSRALIQTIRCNSNAAPLKLLQTHRHKTRI